MVRCTPKVPTALDELVAPFLDIGKLCRTVKLVDRFVERVALLRTTHNSVL